MERNTSKLKMTKKAILLPPISGDLPKQKKSLPFNGYAVTEKGFSFSFACFDRSHELFNLGSSSAEGVVSGNWFVDLLDCFKSVSNKPSKSLRYQFTIYTRLTGLKQILLLLKGASNMSIGNSESTSQKGV